MTAREPLGVGERAADFVLSGPSGVRERFYARVGGRPAVVVFDAGGGSRQLLDLRARLTGRSDVDLHCVTRQPYAGDGAMTVWHDPDGGVRAAYGVPDGGTTVVVLDPNLRVAGVVPGADTELVVDLLDGVAHRDPPVEVVAQAPVLLIQRVLNKDFRERLVAAWEKDGGVETGVARVSGEVLDETYKRRRDLVVRDAASVRAISTTVGQRVMPEIERAFAFRATRFEGFKVACYEAAAGGFFRAHRDNLTPATAHRVFALTLNLNDGYEGGQLRFPEYGNQLYRPDAGAALVFSCAHLHEVREVTAGRRLVLLSFLS